MDVSFSFLVVRHGENGLERGALLVCCVENRELVQLLSERPS